MNKLDTSIDEIHNNRFMARYYQLIKYYPTTSEFSERDVACLLMVFYKFVLVNGPQARRMSLGQFRNIFLVLFEIYDSVISERIAMHLSEDAKFVDAMSWLNLISTYMSTDLNMRMRFAFKIYASNSRGYLQRQDVSERVQWFFEGDDEDEVNEMRTDMTELIMNKFDTDHDGFITYEEYSQVVSKQPELLEFLGQCFPSKSRLIIIAHCTNLISYIELYEI